MREKGFESYLEGFNPNEPTEEPIRNGAPVTIWLPAEDKARYDRLQQKTKRAKKRFSEVARDMLRDLIEAAEKRAS